MLVTDLRSTQTNMSNDINQIDTTLIIKPTSIEINNSSNGTMHENGTHHYSPSKSLKFKIGEENNHEIMNDNEHSENNLHDHIYEAPSNIDHSHLSSLEKLIISSSNEQGSKNDQGSYLSSLSFSSPHFPICSNDEHYLNNGLDNCLSSEMTNNSTEIHHDEESNSTSGIATTSIISTARLLEINQPHESNSTSGVIIPEEKRVTDRVKVFEAVANNDQLTIKKQIIKNGNQKKLSPNDHKQKVSPSSTTTTTENTDVQESKSSTINKNKPKRPSLKKQIQNLLKIDKTSSQDETTTIDEQTSVTISKRINTNNSTRNNGKTNEQETFYSLLFFFFYVTD